MRHFSIVLLVLVACATTTSSGPGAAGDSTAFVEAQTAALQPLMVEQARTWFDASTTGTDEAWATAKDAANRLNLHLADPVLFARVQEHRAARSDDPIVARQVEVMYLMMLGKQVEPALLENINALEAQVQKAFNTYRAELAGKKVTQNDIETILATSVDSSELQAAWQAQKDVGVMVAPILAELVVLRNQVAQSLGFRDFYAMRLAESEIDEAELLSLFDELDRLTREPFLAAKADLDARVSKRIGIAAPELMPWHYQNPFFQEPPEVFETGLDALFQTQDTVKLSRDFFEGIDLEVDKIIASSDLFEKDGKTPHAFAADIDREGDIRVICNIVPGLRWQQTTVHELGHAVYDAYIDHELPFLLRVAAHPLTTEGLAMMIDRAVAHPRWALQMGLIDAATAQAATSEAEAYLAFAPLQFSRWTQVMLRFERELYRDPGQDLSAVWWDLVEKYQGLRRPVGRDAPDYASKIHLVVAPVYYHNYMMGELFGAQVHEVIAATVDEDPSETVYVGRPKVGAFLKEKVFGPGSRWPWYQLVEHATGKALDAEAFARRFQN